MSLNGVLKFDRITDDRQWQQTLSRTPFFLRACARSRQRPLSSLNVFRRAPDNGSLSILLEFIPTPIYLFIYLFQPFALISKRGTEATCADFSSFFFWRVAFPPPRAAVFIFHLLEAGRATPKRERPASGGFQKTLRLSVAAVSRWRYLILTARRGRFCSGLYVCAYVRLFSLFAWRASEVPVHLWKQQRLIRKPNQTTPNQPPTPRPQKGISKFFS